MITLALAAALAAAIQAAVPPPGDPTPLEHALVEYRCSTAERFSPGTYAYSLCYDRYLPQLRASFGVDLARLPAADRRAINDVCGEPSAAAGREAYVRCLDTQLTAVRERMAAARPGPPLPQDDAVAEAPLPAPVSPSAPDAAVSASATWWIGGAVAIAGLGAAGAVAARRSRKPAAVTCRACGGEVPGAGDLCAACRREAAESRRRAATERSPEPEPPAAVDPARRLAEEQAALERREHERREREQRLQADEEMRRREELERRQRVADERRRQEAAAAEVFNPNLVLGIEPGASRAAILAAYEQARAKYAPSECEHLGAEVQDHFKAKAAAVERAFRMLMA
jgi:hypothetical protein